MSVPSRRHRVPDEYTSFDAMAAAQIEGTNFLVEYEIRDHHVAILAIHGGAIERHTDTLARDIAAEEWSYYTLIGRRRSENKRYLHVASEQFEERRLTAVLQRAQRVVSIHGVDDQDQPFVMLGGLDLDLKTLIEHRLLRAGIVQLPPRPGLTGVDRRNVCNRGSTGRGVQIEISTCLRDLLASDPLLRHAFRDAVRSACSQPR